MVDFSVRKNHFGFYGLVEKLSPSELKNYYAEKYYQDSSEVEYFKNKLQKKYLAVLKFLPDMGKSLYVFWMWVQVKGGH
ncbi:MAG: hypothetical protein DRP47_06605 [Candidatus Zixiibacteriota bacterium]|nr:MAG: hypothetical protein DRP47_06605 [candidate division Zixibacteria bacterium]